MANALATVQSFFPKVKRVVDANKDAFIEVTKADTNSAQVQQHDGCALAVACRKAWKLDGVIISRRTAYLVKGNRARRFQLPDSTSREIVSFDRGAGFAEGRYELHRPPKCARLGVRPGRGGSKNHTPNGNYVKQFRHITTGIRTVLGSEVANEIKKRSR